MIQNALRTNIVFIQTKIIIVCFHLMLAGLPMAFMSPTLFAFVGLSHHINIKIIFDITLNISPFFFPVLGKFSRFLWAPQTSSFSIVRKNNTLFDPKVFYISFDFKRNWNICMGPQNYRGPWALCLLCLCISQPLFELDIELSRLYLYTSKKNVIFELV